MEHSNENKSYRCACCGQDFDNITTWKAHMLHSHMDLILPASLSVGMGIEQTPKHKCAYCISTFRTEAELNLHILTHQKVNMKNFFTFKISFKKGACMPLKLIKIESWCVVCAAFYNWSNNMIFIFEWPYLICHICRYTFTIAIPQKFDFWFCYCLDCHLIFIDVG